MESPKDQSLAPYLFLIYINDIVNCSNVLHFVLFADDTNLFHSGRDLASLYTVINKELVKLNNWFHANKLSLNISKTNYILFGNKRKINNVNIGLSINGSTILETNTVRFLGVMLDSGLSWRAHIDFIATKIASGLGIMNKVRNMLPMKAMQMLYFSLIYPYLQYCNIIWGVAKEAVISKLIVLQKRAVRLCTNSIRKAHSEPLFVKLGLLKLSEINKYQTLLFMYKFRHSLLPLPCMNLVPISTTDKAYATRHTSYF